MEFDRWKGKKGTKSISFGGKKGKLEKKERKIQASEIQHENNFYSTNQK